MSPRIGPFTQRPSPMNGHQDWWQNRREELLALAVQQRPTVVFNEEILNEHLFDLLSMEAVDRVYFPVRLNSHPRVLAQAKREGAGFECVLYRELVQVLKLFPGLDSEQVLFHAGQARFEGGDLLLFSHMGTHPHGQVHQHYLNARRICQVRL